MINVDSEIQALSFWRMVKYHQKPKAYFVVIRP